MKGKEKEGKEGIRGKERRGGGEGGATKHMSIAVPHSRDS